MRVASRRCSSMPMDEASIAQACAPSCKSLCRLDCSMTASGVVNPLDTRLPFAPGSGTKPAPSVPTMAQRRRAAPVSADRACASHQTVDVFPFVPVTARTCMACDGCAKKVSLMGPLRRLSAAQEAMRSSVKLNTGTPLCSTRHAAAPCASAACTCARASWLAPGQARKPSPAPSLRLSVCSVPLTRSPNQRAASCAARCCCIKNSPPLPRRSAA